MLYLHALGNRQHPQPSQGMPHSRPPHVLPYWTPFGCSLGRTVLCFHLVCVDLLHWNPSLMYRTSTSPSFWLPPGDSPFAQTYPIAPSSASSISVPTLYLPSIFISWPNKYCSLGLTVDPNQHLHLHFISFSLRFFFIFFNFATARP